MILAFVVLSRLLLFGFVFPREFNVLLRLLCYVCHVVGSCFFGCSRVETWNCCVTSPGKLSSAVVEFVAPWCYGFGTVLDFFRWLAPRWASSGPARVGGRSCENGKRSFEEFQRVQESQAMFKRERARALARRFKLSGFGHRPQAAGPIRASVRGGAPPMSRLSGVEHTWSGIPFIPWKIQTYRFYMPV